MFEFLGAQRCFVIGERQENETERKGNRTKKKRERKEKKKEGILSCSLMGSGM